MIEQLQSSETLPEINLNDRVAIFGGTGSGKSVLAHALLRSIPKGWWKIIIDVTDTINEPTALDFYDPTKIPWDEVSEGDDAMWTMRFVPNIDASLYEQISILYMEIYNHGACWVWLDEANEVSTAHKTAFGLRKVLLQGRKAWIGHAACTPRPADISKSIVTQSQYLICFSLVDFDDRQRMSRYIGMAPDEFDEVLSQLGKYEYLFYDVAERTLYHVPPVPEDIVIALETPVPSEA